MNKLHLKIGLTGNLGTGKSTVAKLMEKYGAKVLDADKVVHQLLERKDIKEKLLQTLGRDILTIEGKVDRKKVAERVFKDRPLLKWLEELLHPLVYEEFEKFCTREGGICVLEAALIFENKNQNRFHYTILVYAPKEVAKRRAMQRGMSEEDFNRRWERQMDIEVKKTLADFVIDNSKSLEETEKQVRGLMYRFNQELKRFC
ncbi:MAG TPA: dephospho-CoA kinase [Aquifex aeolicus]|nr:dephospho-CoA kinase [Aquificales bacterium]HIQ26526.1 dephospho-CoA kinase [Aquifex aeolicus]